MTRKEFDDHLTSGRHVVRSLKARSDARRTPSQRLADWMTDVFGSNRFLVVNVVWFVAWTMLNARIIPGLQPFDPFPFSLLTTIVSLEAIVLSVFVLIAQNRSARIDQLRSEVDLQVNLITERELTKVLSLVARIAEKQSIDVSGDAELQAMLNPTNIEKLERVIDAQLGEHGHDHGVLGS